VLLIVIDACRPDFPPDLPLEFTSAVSPAPWTFPAVTSIHTGLYPHEHGAVKRDNEGSGDPAVPDQYPLKPLLPTLFEVAGYDTFGAFAFYVPFLALREWYQSHSLWDDASAEQVVERYRMWRDSRERTFAYLHFGDLHEPLNPPSTYIEREEVDTSLDGLERLQSHQADYDGSEEHRYYRKHRLRLYRAALSHVEDTLRPLVKTAGDDTLLIVTGDHGEAHWEHYEVDRSFPRKRDPQKYGLGHGGTPFDMVARVPLAVQAPDGSVTTPVAGGWPSLVDVPRTLLDAVMTVNTDLGCCWTEPIPKDRIAFCEGVRFGNERKAAYRGQHKVIHSRQDDVTLTAEVDLEQGGEQFTDIPESEKAELLAALPEDWEMGNDINRINSEIVMDRLKALGYQ
jgi:arylsulfatase A-like enzyme